MTASRYYWNPAVWGDIPPQAWYRTRPDQPPTPHVGAMPVSDTLCASCHRPLAQALVDADENHHVTCGPDRRPMTRAHALP